MTMYDNRTRLSTKFGKRSTRLPRGNLQDCNSRTVRLSEAPSFGQTIFEYDPTDKGPKPIWHSPRKCNPDFSSRRFRMMLIRKLVPFLKKKSSKPEPAPRREARTSALHWLRFQNSILLTEALPTRLLTNTKEKSLTTNGWNFSETPFSSHSFGRTVPSFPGGNEGL